MLRETNLQGGNRTPDLDGAATANLDVSVVLSVKNEEIYVESALESILAQSGLSFEVIVVDDGSIDATHAIVSGMLSDHANLHLFRNPGRGKCAAFNYGVSQSRGKFACLFAGDDLMPQGSLAQRFVAVKDRPPQNQVVGLCRLITMSEDKRFDGHLVPRRPGRGVHSGQSYLMNEAAVESFFPVPEDLPNEDTWLEIAVTFLPGVDVVHSGVIGCAWRVHQGNSINMLVGFDEFNRKYTARMRAYSVFYDRHKDELTDEGRAGLSGLIKCEASRKTGNVIGVLLSPVGVVPKLRALSLTNKAIYWIRARLYGLLSGW
jgi:glycosyltransferase involved in cell wall biosynthesis